jgi:hypothetical protein
MKMVVHGRRSYGEDWQEVTVGVDNDEIKVIESRPTVAPPGGKPIMVPGMGNLSMEAVDFLIEGARKSQEYGGKSPQQMSLAEYTKWINETWQNFAEQKLKWFRGQTTLGPGGFYQRETPGRTHWKGR